jgi:hypothetical protein
VREALGRFRGGYGTKACVIADGRGRAIAFALAPGQAHELPLAPGLLAVCRTISHGFYLSGITEGKATEAEEMMANAGVALGSVRT